MSKLHPDLDPKKQPTMTIKRWNLWLYRLLINRLIPKVERPENVESSVVHVDDREFHIHRPTNKTSKDALFWIHGGGLIMGNPAQENYTHLTFANELGITVIAITYRVAPQHPFPTPLDDCHQAW